MYPSGYTQKPDGSKPFTEWLQSIRDKIVVTRIRTRLFRLENGNFGDHRSVGNSVFELRLDFGPGYRIYYAEDGEDVVLLLAGGDEEARMMLIQMSLEENYDMPEAILSALKLVAEARGFKKFAEDANLSRESLYRTLSKNGNPKLETIFKMLNSMGLRLSVEPIKKRKMG